MSELRYFETLPSGWLRVCRLKGKVVLDAEGALECFRHEVGGWVAGMEAGAVLLSQQRMLK
jgi:hypothetical protein